METVARKKKEAAKSARKDLHRTLVIEAAERAFAEKGYDGTRMQDIANRPPVREEIIKRLEEGSA